MTSIAEDFRNLSDEHNLVYRVLVGRMGFLINRVTPVPLAHRTLLTLYLLPGKEAKDSLALSGAEVICIVCPFDSVDYRVVKAALDGMGNRDRRPESSFCLVAARPDSAPRDIHGLAFQEPATFATFSFDELRHLVDLPQDCLPALRRKVASKDLYNLRVAVQSSSDFFGRRPLLASVQRDLLAGKSVGLFGLRKVGKTSFLHQLVGRLKQVADACVCYLDFQVADTIERSTDALVEAIGVAIDHSLPKRMRQADFEVLSPSTPARLRLDRHDLRRRLANDLQRIWQKRDHVLIVAIDEIDIMLSRGKSTGWESCFVESWRFLRGLAQQSGGRLAYFVTGTNPHLVEAPSVGGHDNPLFSWIDPSYIGPLSYEESAELLDRLGRRMQLSWTEPGMRFVHARVAGHPLLTRMYGSAVHATLGERNHDLLVDEAAARDALPRLKRSAAPMLNMILELMRDSHPDDYIMLELLAAGRMADFKALYQHSPQDAQHLIGYGIASPSGDVLSIDLALVQDWMLERARQQRTMVSLQDSRSISELEAEGFASVSLVTNCGGFADVYKADDPSIGAVVAIKVFRDVDLSALQRECDILERVRHNSIVRVYRSGCLVSKRPFLVMEFLPGSPLTTYLSAGSRMERAQVLRLARDILDALVAIHPKVGPAEDVGDAKSFDEFMRRQQMRQGYVHRDIKPENVMEVPGRGFVLFDFGIASHAGSNVRTVSHSPGYRPDLVGERWDPVCDLYALGVTIAEVASGRRRRDVDAGALGDLLEEMRVVHGAGLSDFASRLCQIGDGRFATAQDAMHAVTRMES